MSETVRRFRDARRDPTLAVLEGLHAVKHALRFGAEIVESATVDPDGLADLARRLAPDVAETIVSSARPMPEERFAALSPSPVPTRVVAMARRPEVDASAVLAAPGPEPVVVLEGPSRLDNVGAVVRVAAAAGAAGVLTTGAKDPWSPAALRGSAGLHYALPVARVEALPETGRPLVALDPGGEPLGSLPERALLAFGTEREGLSAELLERALVRVRIPMREGVSSLNLAVAAGIVLYAERPRRGAGGGSQR